MNVAILTSSLPPLPVGGAERQAWETARRLAARGHRVTVFARRHPAERAGVDESDGVRWIRADVAHIPGLSFPGHLWSFRRAWAAHHGGADVILAYQTVINGVLGALAARSGIPLVTWIRSEDEYDFRRLKFRWFTPAVLRRSTRVLVQSEAIRDRLLEALAARVGEAETKRLARRLERLSNAVSIGPEPSANGREGLLAVGQLNPCKGFDVLLQALRALPDPPPLTLIGEGPQRGELEAAARGLPVTFPGFVRDLPERMNRARLLMAPSRTEGFPNVVLEAMERGLPAVTTLVGALPDLVVPGETGWVVPIDDAPAIARVLRGSYEDVETLSRMGRRSREVALGYGWEPHLDRLEAILREVVAEG